MIRKLTAAVFTIILTQSAVAQTPPPKPGANLAAMTAQCQKQLGPGAVAQEDFSQGSVSYYCNCAKPYVWNEKGDGCKRPQLSIIPDNTPPGAAPVPPVDNPGSAQQVPPDDSDDAPVATQPPPDVTPPPDANPQPPVVRRPPPKRKKPSVRRDPRHAVPRPRGRDRVRPRNGPAIARSFCRRKYGRRLVRVEPKRSKFYCYYKGKRSLGNSPTRWKKYKYKYIR